MKIRLVVLLCIVLTACSTTRNLPEGEVLYTGIKQIQIENEDKTPAGENALAEVKAALACQPNNALLGSSSIRYPFPLGLWAYNSFVKYKRGIGKWIFNKLAAKPVLISTVNPEIRVRVAQNMLKDYGFFNGTVTSEVLPNKRNERKAKIRYQIDMRNPYVYDTIIYPSYSKQADSLVYASLKDRMLHKGENFSVVMLDQERQRISTLLRNEGYFYFRPEFIGFRADTIQHPGKVSLEVAPKNGLPASALRPWRIGDVSVYLNGNNGEQPIDSMRYKKMMIHYSPPLKVRPSVLYNCFGTRSGNFYSQTNQVRTQERLNRLGIFRYTEMQYVPRDTTAVCDTLDVTVNTAFDLPLDGELELNVTSKSNDMIGPGAVFSLSKRNVFHGGENLSVRLRGSYEWQTNSSVDGSSSVINSYELGLSGLLTFPRVLFPWLTKREFNNPASTTFRLYVDQLNRASYFKMLAFGGSGSYSFQPTAVSKHSFTPFKLTFSLLQHTTSHFDSIMQANPALYLSLKDQFIPSMSYTYTYDNTSIQSKRNHLWWESSVTSAGNILSGVYAAFGKGFKEQKKLLGNPFAQFLKATSEVRYLYKISGKQFLAMRLMGGLIHSYGNSTVAPYSEQFYIGGANSIRAFTIRSLGPGSYHPKTANTYSYIDQTGDVKLEANIEYRFPILGNLHGALFLDAGNIWLLKNDPIRPGGQLTLKHLGNDIALGTGAGLRYDLTFLVIRLDMGIALHAPYQTSKKGYYNIPRFKDGIGVHLAIGYPF